MNLGLEGRIALVTGGAHGVGREIALALVDKGATVAINYHSSEAAARDLVEEIEVEGGSARAYPGDVTDYDAVVAMIDAIVGDFDRLDVLVNNAGFV